MTDHPHDPGFMTPPEPPQADLDDLFGLELDWHRWWTIIPEIIALVATGAIPVLISLGVVARYTDWFRIPWANDVVGVLFLWVVFLGGAVAVKHGAHVRMEALADRIARRGRPGRLWAYVIRLSPIGMGGTLLVLGWRIVGIHMTRELTWLEIPLGYFSSVIPVSGMLMIIYTVASLRRDEPTDGSSGSDTTGSIG